MLRAHISTPRERTVYIQFPAEDEQGEGMLGLLNLCLYGTRDAATNWQETLSEHLVSIGFTRGVGHPCVFEQKKMGATYSGAR